MVSATDGLRVAYYRWPSQAKSVGVVQIAHGLGEHALRYAPLAEFLNQAGYLVYAHDHRGHGRTSSPQSYGDFGEAGWSAVVADTVQLTNIIKRREPDIPVVLLGHSMGSFVAQNYILDHGDLIDGCALSGSAAADLIQHLLDEVGDGGLESLNAPFEPGRTPFDWLSRDPAQVDAYVADTACGFDLNERSRESAKAAWQRAADMAEIQQIRKALPIYIFAGDADPVNHNLDHLRPLAQRYRAVGIRDVQEKYNPEGRHEMFNETNRHEVMADLRTWLDRVVKR